MHPPTYDARETARMHEVHGAPLASFGRRAAAFAIDFALAGLLFLTVVIPAAVGLVRLGLVEVHGDVMLRLNFFKNWYSVVWLVLYFALATYFGKGQTPGKRLLRIRVVSLAHDRLSLWHATERALGYAASALEFGFGFLQYFIHPNRRTVHDRIAETIVVDERAPGGSGAQGGNESEPDSST
jgi:uncharacterized RDD family membrane protein YckC